MKRHLVYSTGTIGFIIAIVGLAVMMFITACGKSTTGPSIPVSTTGTAVATQSPCVPGPNCKPGINTECVMGDLLPPPDSQQLLSQFPKGFIVFYTQINDVSGNLGNYKITASIPVGLLRNQKAITEVDTNGKTDTSAVNNAVLKGQTIIIAAVLNPDLLSFTGIQILPSNQKSFMDCGQVVEFVIPTVGQNTTVMYWQGGDQPLSVDLGAFPSTDVTKPVLVFTLFQAGSSPTVLSVQNVKNV